MPHLLLALRALLLALLDGCGVLGGSGLLAFVPEVVLDLALEDLIWVEAARVDGGLVAEGAFAAHLFELVLDAGLAGDLPAAAYLGGLGHDVAADLALVALFLEVDLLLLGVLQPREREVLGPGVSGDPKDGLDLGGPLVDWPVPGVVVGGAVADVMIVHLPAAVANVPPVGSLCTVNKNKNK